MQVEQAIFKIRRIERLEENRATRFHLDRPVGPVGPLRAGQWIIFEPIRDPAVRICNIGEGCVDVRDEDWWIGPLMPYAMPRPERVIRLRQAQLPELDSSEDAWFCGVFLARQK